MTCRSQSVAVGLVITIVLLLSASAIAWSAAIIRDGDSNTIGEAVSRPDGAVVTLTCEQVMWRGKSGRSFAIKEFFEKWPEQPRLLVVSGGLLPVEPHWCVDVTGVLQTLTGTLPGGATFQQRVLVVSPENVSVYCDRQGRSFPVFPIKGYTDSGYTKRPLASATHDGAALPSVPDTPDPPPPTVGSRDSIRSLPDGALVSVNGIVVSCSISGRFAVERGDRSYGIWANYANTIPERALVDIIGRMATEGGSRVVVADTVTVLETDFPQSDPLGMSNRNLHYGLDTSGKLVRVWGKVTSADSENRIFFIDDGSGINDGDGAKVYDYSTESLPSIGAVVVIDGASGSEEPGDIRNVTKTTSTVLVHTESLMQSVSGTISGSVTAQGANGGSVRVYCGKASTKATLVGDTANHTLKIPYGSHAVTISVAGFKTTTKLVHVNEQTPDPTLDVNLSALEKRIDITATQMDTLADGSKEFAITAVYRDEEGRRIANAPITWDADGGSVVSSHSVTDVVGEAKAVVRCASSATIEARAGEVSSAKPLD